MKGDTGEKARPFDTLHAQYDAWYKKEPGRSLFALEVDLLRRVMPEETALSLEVGVGSGRFAQALAVAFGVDPARSPLRLARERGIRVIQGTGEHLPFPAETFQTCLLVVTLCFVQDPLAVLREAFRVLRRGGVVVLGMVLKESPWGRVYRKQADDGHPFYSLATFYTALEVFEMLRQAGFGATEAFSTLFQPPGQPRYDLEDGKQGAHPNAGFTVFRAEKPGDSPSP